MSIGRLDLIKFRLNFYDKLIYKNIFIDKLI